MSASQAGMATLIAASVTAAEWRLPRGTCNPRMREASGISIKPNWKLPSGAEQTEYHIGSMISPLGKRSTCTRPTWIRRCPYRLDETVYLLASRALSSFPAPCLPAQLQHPISPRRGGNPHFAMVRALSIPDIFSIFSLKVQHLLLLTDH